MRASAATCLPPSHTSHRVWLAIACCWQPAQAQFAQQVLKAGLYNQPVTKSPLTATPGSSSPATTLEPQAASPELYQPGVMLPRCPASSILQTSQGIPENWDSMSAQQQASSPAIPLVIQLAYAVWKDNAARDMGTCLSAMGIDADSIQQISFKVQPYGGTMTALVMRAGSKGVFVSFRGTDFEDPGDVLIDADCHHTENVRRFFTDAGTGNVRLHTGFYASWQELEQEVTRAIDKQLQQVDANKRVYFIGHSLGGALAAIAALRYNFLWSSSSSRNQIGGVFLFGCPRIGNTGWASLYNQQLLTKTLRMSNYADFASRLPMQTQICPLTHLNGTFTFSHIGRSLVLCPNPRTGMVEWVLAARGTEKLSCGMVTDAADMVGDLSVRTHWLGAYLDAWRRGYTQATGVNLANDPRLANVVCSDCGTFYMPPDSNRQVNMPARGGGPVTCSVSASCTNRQAWDAAALIDSTYVKRWSLFSTCMGYLCM